MQKYLWYKSKIDMIKNVISETKSALSIKSMLNKHKRGHGCDYLFKKRQA